MKVSIKARNKNKSTRILEAKSSGQLIFFNVVLKILLRKRATPQAIPQSMRIRKALIKNKLGQKGITSKRM